MASRPASAPTSKHPSQLLAVNTVRSQVQAIYRKLGVSSRAEAVTQAHQLGLLPKA
jgi:ATP/maltotriose-dependent transcriptional regulator MalT